MHEGYVNNQYEQSRRGGGRLKHVRINTEISIGVSTSVQHNHFHMAEVTNLAKGLSRLKHCTCKLSLIPSYVAK